MIDAPTLRLACATGQGERNYSLSTSTGRKPALLVSFVYLKFFLENRKRNRYQYRDWAFDSGAFSAYSRNMKISLGDYIAKCRELRATDSRLTEIFSLDVIGDWRASMRNTELMWKAGVEAIPCYHYREPIDVLIGMARDYPKIAFGGVAARTRAEKQRWALECMQRIWPTKVHGFGYGSPQTILTVPFHSTDATTWETRPCAFGYWQQFGARLDVRGNNQDLRGEVQFYLDLEARARARWAREMAELECRKPAHVA